MNNTTRRLGRGLEALLGRSLDEAPAVHADIEAALSADTQLPSCMGRDESGQTWLDLAAIDSNPHQPRKAFDEVEIADLADSIRAHGVLQPLVVRRNGERFQLVAGERRMRAALAAGWERVPVQLRDVTDQQMAELAIVENVQRKDLNAIEKGACFQRYLEEFGCTQDELAKRIHIDRSTIANLIRLLELPSVVKTMIATGELTQGHARALLPLGDETRQVSMARRVKNDGLSVRATEQAVQDELTQTEPDGLRLVDSDGNSHRVARPTATGSEQVAQLEQELKAATGTQVTITRNAKGKGKLTLHFASLDEFERLRALLHGAAGAVRQAG